jgi:hypothetical protein
MTGSLFGDYNRFTGGEAILQSLPKDEVQLFQQKEGKDAKTTG